MHLKHSSGSIALNALSRRRKMKKLLAFINKIRKRIAYVPSVNDTVNAMKDIGIDLKQEKKKSQ